MSVPAPSVAVRFVQGIHRRDSAVLSAPSMTTGLVKVISPHFHARGVGELPSASADSTHVVGFRNSGAATLTSPRHARAVAHRSYLVLQTPAQARDFRFGQSQLWGYVLDAVSLYRQFGEWKAGYLPVPEELDGVDLSFRGGHRHVIDPDIAQELSDAGFYDYIRTEVSK